MKTEFDNYDEMWEATEKMIIASMNRMTGSSQDLRQQWEDFKHNFNSEQWKEIVDNAMQEIENIPKLVGKIAVVISLIDSGEISMEVGAAALCSLRINVLSLPAAFLGSFDRSNSTWCETVGILYLKKLDSKLSSTVLRSILWDTFVDDLEINGAIEWCEGTYSMSQGHKDFCFFID